MIHIRLLQNKTWRSIQATAICDLVERDPKQMNQKMKENEGCNLGSPVEELEKYQFIISSEDCVMNKKLRLFFKNSDFPL